MGFVPIGVWGEGIPAQATKGNRVHELKKHIGESPYYRNAKCIRPIRFKNSEGFHLVLQSAPGRLSRAQSGCLLSLSDLFNRSSASPSRTSTFRKFQMSSREATKRIAGKFAWVRLLQAAQGVSFQHHSNMTREAKLRRYTNFSLDQAWEKYHFLENHLLLRESVIPTMATNAQLFDIVVDELPDNIYT